MTGDGRSKLALPYARPTDGMVEDAPNLGYRTFLVHMNQSVGAVSQNSLTFDLRAITIPSIPVGALPPKPNDRPEDRRPTASRPVRYATGLLWSWFVSIVD